MATRVAVVTGSNKGVGLATVRALCKKFDGDVYLTARDEGRGKDAVKSLEEEGLHPKFHQLDITSQDSINKLKIFLEQNYGGIDILVNNAGIAYKVASPEPFSEQAEVSMGCNFYGTLNTCKTLFPLLKPHSRVVNVASIAGIWAIEKMNRELLKRYQASSLTESELISLQEQFVSDSKAGNHKEKGWPNLAYGMSKLGVLALTYILGNELQSDPREDILLNCCCPGAVQTDMSTHTGDKTPDEGATMSVYLALLPPNAGKPQGEFLKNDKVISWRSM
ncbi:carbonyl reductase [NADPH] 1-like [Glandiceps talaboti]